MPRGGGRGPVARPPHPGDPIEVLVGGAWTPARLHAWSEVGGVTLGHVEYRDDVGTSLLERLPQELIRRGGRAVRLAG